MANDNDQVLRTGVLFKKGSGSGPFGRKNWKPRYFILTPTKLTYFTYEDGELKGEVDLTRCSEQSLEVMPTDSMKTGSSASTIWRVAINSPERRLLIAANTEVEMNEWVEQFRIAFAINSGQPVPMPAQRGSASQAPGAVTSTRQPEGTAGIVDFQNFAAARRSVGGAMRASAGNYPGHEFRLSDDLIRHQQAEHERLEQEHKQQEIEAARLREEEIHRLEMLKGEQTTRQSSTEIAEEERREVALEAQRHQRLAEHEQKREAVKRQQKEEEIRNSLAEQPLAEPVEPEQPAAAPEQTEEAEPAVEQVQEQMQEMHVQEEQVQEQVQNEQVQEVQEEQVQKEEMQEAQEEQVQQEVQQEQAAAAPVAVAPTTEVEITRARPQSSSACPPDAMPTTPTKPSAAATTTATPPSLTPLTSFEM